MDVQTRPERGNSLGRASRPMTQQRKKVGIIVPSCNTVVEPDFGRVALAGVIIPSARMWILDNTVDAHETMNKDVETCAKYLGTAAVDISA